MKMEPNLTFRLDETCKRSTNIWTNENICRKYRIEMFFFFFQKETLAHSFGHNWNIYSKLKATI